MMSSDKLLLVLRLAVGLFCGVLNGIDMSFNVYAVSLKETFNFTQMQVEIVSSMVNTGFGLSFLENFLTGVFGYKTSFIASWVTVSLCCELFSLAAVYKDFFHDWPVLICLNQLFLCAGTGFAYVLVTRICLEIVPANYTGTFIGMHGTAMCFGKIAFAGIYELYNDLVGSFRCLSVIFGTALGICFTLLYPVAKQLEKGTKSELERNKTHAEQDLEFKAVLRLPRFYMMLLSSAAFSAMGFVMLKNITYITDSIGIRDPFITVTTMSVCIMTTRLLYGLVYDKVSSEIFGFVLLFSGYISMASALVIGMYFLNTTTVHILTVLSGIAIGPAMYLPLGIFVSQYGRSNYSYISTSLFALMAVLQIPGLVIVGFLYDNKRTVLKDLGNHCEGPDCFFWSMCIFLILVVSICIVQSINLVLTVLSPSSKYTALE